MNEINCKSCGAFNHPDAKFCVICNKSLSALSETVKQTENPKSWLNSALNEPTSHGGIMEKRKNVLKRIEEQNKKITEKIDTTMSNIEREFFGDEREPDRSDECLMQELAISLRDIITSGNVEGKFDITGEEMLQRIDKLFNNIFQIQRYFLESNLWYKTMYCETLEEFFEPFAEMLNVSAAQKKKIIQSWVKKSRDQAMQGGFFGVNFPGQGCYINGWLYGTIHNMSAKAALKDPKIRPEIYRTVAHEKLGHGFITSFSLSGKEKSSIHMEKINIANRFNLQLADSPEDFLLNQKWNLILNSSKFVEEGWATWVENFMDHCISTGKPEDYIPRHYSFETLANVLTQLVESETNPVVAQAGNDCIEGLDKILSGRFDSIENVQETMIKLEQAESVIENSIISSMGQSFRYVFGYLLMVKAAYNLGWMALPYAVTVACNVTFNLDKLSVSDLEKTVRENPKLNVNTRFVLISMIKVTKKNDIQTMLQKIEEQLSFVIPTNLKPKTG
ncbi:MAG: hypothetical protein A2161_19075 [Candidatus Schekmanbacteria bacterium RBG_13_48_7]|uniref:Zinc ribbon domain-containing protein n=1 Tax=Candidatus Schekmanbacteria bacterium RBG_13_48_7 TaxID=1817878 RepID=A0A1F7RQP5_9BACT|nr:MAG: hypothetical protein A2161_19075 [Candidatus Schekmanbacteria bacterium RBG_13_48_7]